MPHVIFVAPFFQEATLRFLRGAAELEGIRLSLITQEAAEKVPPPVAARLGAHWRIADGLDPEQISGAVRALAARHGPPTRIFGALEQLQVPLAQVREALGIPGMGVEAARNFRDKSRMKSLLESAGVPCARHRLIARREEALAFVDQIGFPVVVKPPAGAGARNTFRLDRGDDLREYLDIYPPDAGHPTLFEEFVTGREHSFDSICIQGRPVWHSISRYFPTPLEVMETPWIQWVVVLPREIDGPEFADIREAALRTLEILGIGTGLSHLEWFRRPDGGLAISEVAARPPGAQFTTLISYAHDLDFYRAWPRLMATDVFVPPAREYAAGAAFLRGQGQGRVRAIHGLEAAQREIGSVVVEARLPREGQASSGTYEGDGYVIVRHPDTAVVEHALARVVSLIRVELA
jgi:biotin carboxylase